MFLVDGRVLPKCHKHRTKTTSSPFKTNKNKCVFLHWKNLIIVSVFMPIITMHLDSNLFEWKFQRLGNVAVGLNIRGRKSFMTFLQIVLNGEFWVWSPMSVICNADQTWFWGWEWGIPFPASRSTAGCECPPRGPSFSTMLCSCFDLLAGLFFG